VGVRNESFGVIEAKDDKQLAVQVGGRAWPGATGWELSGKAQVAVDAGREDALICSEDEKVEPDPRTDPVATGGSQPAQG
jgi:hypothetical protein